MSERFETQIELPDPDSTEELGRRIGEHLDRGDSVALIGELGAGKTGLTRGIARGLGVEDPDAVTSPTYLLAIEHAGPCPLLHVDAYLPEKTRGFLLDGGVDYLDEVDGVVVVEWADRLEDLLPAARSLRVELGPRPGGGRVATLSGGPKYAWMLALGNS